MIKKLIIPSHIQIATVEGKCNYRCIMCPINESERQKVMDNQFFTAILKTLKPYMAEQKFLSLLGLGETLIDKEVCQKVFIAKKMHFKGIGIFTNGELLTEKISECLLKVGLDSLIVSIDGYTDEIQKSIRKGSNLNKIIKNIDDFIYIREQSKLKTRIIVRFTKQFLNQNEWGDFYNFWKNRLNVKYLDSIFCYHVHNFGGNNSYLREDDIVKHNILNNFKCDQLYDRLTIFSDGSLGLCCGDQIGKNKIGNVLNKDPVILYNESQIFKEYRKKIETGKISELELCRQCSVPYSIATKEICAL